MRGVGGGGDDAEGLGELARWRVDDGWGRIGLTMVELLMRCDLEAVEAQIE